MVIMQLPHTISYKHLKARMFGLILTLPNRLLTIFVLFEVPGQWAFEINVHRVKWRLRLASSHKLAWPSVKCPWRADVTRVHAVRSRSVVDMSVIIGHRRHRRTSKLNHWIKTSIFDCLRLRKRRNVDSKVIELVVRWPHRWLVTETGGIDCPLVGETTTLGIDWVEKTSSAAQRTVSVDLDRPLQSDVSRSSSSLSSISSPYTHTRLPQPTLGFWWELYHVTHPKWLTNCWNHNGYLISSWPFKNCSLTVSF